MVAVRRFKLPRFFFYINSSFYIFLSFKKQRARNTAANLRGELTSFCFFSIGKTLQQLADANQREAEARQAKNIYNLCNVADPNPDLYVFGPPGAEVRILKYELRIRILLSSIKNSFVTSL
jgi:hypothetical protein